MWGMKAAVLVLLLVLGSSSSSGRFIEGKRMVLEDRETRFDCRRLGARQLS